MTFAVYLIGAPGAGKSTVLASFLGTPYETGHHDKPVPHVVYESGWVELGRRRDAFAGTDALSYSIAPAAIAWVTSIARPVRLAGEGDRLATDRFFDALGHAYGTVVIAHVAVDPAVSHDRMVARAELLGRRPQSLSWWKGRVTKSQRLAARWANVELDGTAAPEHNVERLNALVASG